MSLYGALYTGVTGLSTQGQKIGIISDNIANVNTVGYKEAEAQFKTLVVNSGTKSVYSPGGVRNETRLNIDSQGIISSTAAPTDIAVSGNGFFVVNASTDSASQMLYTRAGSFRQDAQGNFVNSQGFYLQGWPLDRDGRLPGEQGNINAIANTNTDSLETVNIESASGVAQATTDIDFKIKLPAGEKVFPGAAGEVRMDINSPNNFNINAFDIIAPDETNTLGTPSFGLAPANNIARGDKFTATTGSGLTYDYEYGGFTIGRNVKDNDLAANTGDNNISLAPIDIQAAGGGITTTASAAEYTVDFGVGNEQNIKVGDRIRLSGVVMGGGSSIPASEFTGIVTVATVGTPVGGGFQTFTVVTSVPEGAVAVSSTSSQANPREYEGNIFDAISENQAFFGAQSNLADYTDAALTFTITSPTIPTGTVTFTYKASGVNPADNTFNSLSNLAEAIDANQGLEARVVDGRLMVGSTDASESLTFANGDAAGNVTEFGIDWLAELGLSDITAGTRRFSTLSNLAAIADNDEGLSAVITNANGEASLDIRVDDPLDTIRFQDFVGQDVALGADPITAITDNGGGSYTLEITQNAHGLTNGSNIVLGGLTDIGTLPALITAAELNALHTITVTSPTTYEITINSAAVGAVTAPGGGTVGVVRETNFGSLLGEFGLVDSLQGGAYVRGDTGNLGPIYDASGANGGNMASGKIPARQSSTFRIYDSLGGGHDIRIAFLKTGINEWATEIYATNPAEVQTVNPDGLIASGTIEFNGDGTLKRLSNSLIRPVEVVWTNGALPSALDLGLGKAGFPTGTVGALEIGDKTGLSQEFTEYTLDKIDQNGAPVGELVSVSIDEDGFVVASFNNGETQNLYKIPLADFSNPNGLKAISGNVYAETAESGELNLRQAGQNGVGDIVSNALEASNVDLAEQLTDMIIAQRAYQANTRVISTSDELLEQLTQL
jgi:flagellar hook-basal body protein